MQKLFFMCAMIVLVTGVSVQAQKKKLQPIGPPTPFDQVISIEDESTGSFLVFHTVGGKYKFTRCADGFTMSGKGFVKVDGCSIHFEDVQADHRVAASVDECTQEARALVEKFLPVSISPNTSTDNPPDISPFDVAPFKVFLSDKNIGNNVMDCGPKK